VLHKKQKINFGKIGEDFAVRLLENKGYQIVARNFRSRFGEIDIIAIYEGELVFIEVKTRWSLKFGNPEEAVTERKLKKIIRTAEYFSMIHPNLPKKLGIKVVAIEVVGSKVISSKILTFGA
jgi:putative endonuclease